jgi:hypothetical protein
MMAVKVVARKGQPRPPFALKISQQTQPFYWSGISLLFRFNKRYRSNWLQLN